MGFFRLFKGELNKLLMRPLLYVLTGVLVVGIFASFLMFSPDERQDIVINDYDECQLVSDAYMAFNNATTAHGKEKANNMLTKAKEQKTNLEATNTDESLQTLNNNLTSLKNALSIYFDDFGSLENDVAKDSEKEAFSNFTTTLTNLKTNFNSTLNSKIVPIILTKDTQQNIELILKETQIAYQNVKTEKHSSHESFRETLTNLNFSQKLTSLFSEIKQKKYSDSDITNLNSKIEKTENYLQELNTQIEKEKTENPQKDEFIKLLKRYYLATVNLYNLVDNIKKYSPYLNCSDKEIVSFYDFKNDKTVFLYQINEQITKQTYLIDTNSSALDYSNVFAQNQNSNLSKNAFDLVYFGLEITSFIIIIFTVVLVAGTIAGEQSSGTLKLLLIRPYSRSKVLTSKLVASLAFSAIFLIFTTIIFFLIGLFVYGVNFAPVLAVFNGQTAFVVHPVVLLLIYLLCLMIKISIYVLIALAISTIFRSNVAAVGISMVLYIVLSILSVSLSGSFWYGFMPFSNFDLFKFFGGSFLSSSNASAISILFSAPVFHNIQFWYAFVMNIILATIITICSYLVFAKREIK